jgi:hypothetical protein
VVPFRFTAERTSRFGRQPGQLKRNAMSLEQWHRLASGRLVLAGARSNRRPRFGSYRFGPVSSADCCERRKCVAEIFAVRDAPAHDEPHSGPNNSEREPTSGRSTKYGSGHLIRVFRDIGRIFSLLFLLSHPSPVGHPRKRRVQSGRRNMVSSKAKMVSIVFRAELIARSAKRKPRPTVP